MRYRPWIYFLPKSVPARFKTRAWEIRALKGRAAEGGALLGEVAWYGRWSGYCFFPEGDAIFNQQCLRTIADFVEKRTMEHRQRKVAESQKPLDPRDVATLGGDPSQ